MPAMRAFGRFVQRAASRTLGPSQQRYMARHEVGFFTQRLGPRSLNEAKRNLGSSNRSVAVA